MNKSKMIYAYFVCLLDSRNYSECIEREDSLTRRISSFGSKIRSLRKTGVIGDHSPLADTLPKDNERQKYFDLNFILKVFEKDCKALDRFSLLSLLPPPY